MNYQEYERLKGEISQNLSPKEYEEMIKEINRLDCIIDNTEKYIL